MNTIVKDGKFSSVGVSNFSFALLEAETHDSSIDLPSDTDPHAIIERVGNAPAIRIDFPTSHDGRGFSIASALRRSGYREDICARMGTCLPTSIHSRCAPASTMSKFPKTLRRDSLKTNGQTPCCELKSTYRERLMRGTSRAA